MLARRSLGFLCFSLCLLSIGAATLMAGGPFLLLFSLMAFTTGTLAVIALRP